MTQSTTPASPLDVLWRAPGVVSVMLAGEGLALLLALAPGPGPGIDRWVYFGLASLYIQWVALLCLAGIYLCRHWLARQPAAYSAWLTMIVLLLATWAVLGLVWISVGDAFALSIADWWSLLWRLSAMVLTVGLLGLVGVQSIWRNRRLAIAAQRAELAALQARVRPHFLFNTLNTGAALIREQPELAEQLLLDLADLFRAALREQHAISLADEVELARRYISIEQLRFGGRLHVQWQLPATLPDLQLPALSLQPLVENAIRHGIEPQAGGGTIVISVVMHADHVLIRVRNPMPGAGQQRARQGHQIGLAATRERIDALSGGLAQLHTEISGGDFVACIELPLPADHSPGARTQ
ncbi:MAG: histidine kinase [Gammaproteobacteria bacterium HGW-Gammaproteobacteria-1]|jgi:two-component system sensor histidine kinase AlgZ|nr:MAG: histidine kinase [Gammaproteobacteria bacterium HGW-Gammaproteobacteria-2]PKM42021.1 MAG: histidine kinase [Gammaproteobacteria bacterium HGW-Gammaproteobacteria-1]